MGHPVYTGDKQKYRNTADRQQFRNISRHSEIQKDKQTDRKTNKQALRKIEGYTT